MSGIPPNTPYYSHNIPYYADGSYGYYEQFVLVSSKVAERGVFLKYSGPSGLGSFFWKVVFSPLVFSVLGFLRIVFS